MDAIKQYMQPKWWLIVIGALGFIAGVANYATAEDSAEIGWGDDYTAIDIAINNFSYLFDNFIPFLFTSSNKNQITSFLC